MIIRSRGFWERLLPKSLGDLERVDIEILPPGHPGDGHGRTARCPLSIGLLAAAAKTHRMTLVTRNRRYR